MIILPDENEVKIGVIGLGYVGLPLATEFGKEIQVIGYDKDLERINQLQAQYDRTGELSADEIGDSTHIRFTTDTDLLADCNVYIVTVPTPIDKNNRPDLKPLDSASNLIGKILARGNVVVYESTVFPGATDEICIPILEKVSGLVLDVDFSVGYSPERINPGDKTRKLRKILKLTSGSNPKTAEFVDDLYRRVIDAGTVKTDSIRIAEAAKVIENTQRDLNIALVNELAIIFNKMGIDTQAVLEAAGTKWNFLPFKPGLVGGHCIGVDPYYLTFKAEEMGYLPEIILAGRRLNDSMGGYVASCMIKAMSSKGINVGTSKVLVLGVTFKENCSDTRNSRVLDLVKELNQYGVDVDCYDPWVDLSEHLSHQDFKIVSEPSMSNYDGVIVAVAHDIFKETGIDFVKSCCKENHIIYDLKSVFDTDLTDLRL